MVGHQLGGHILVELTTVKKALLGRQPKPLNIVVFSFLILGFLGLLLLVLILLHFSCRFRGSEVPW